MIDFVGTAPPNAEQSIFGRGGLGKEDFLLLLVTQLRHQDPLDPLEAQDFASQLAQFTSMEQQIRTNELLEAQNQIDAARVLEAQNGVAIGLIGNSVVTEGDSVELTGSAGDVAFITTDAPTGVTLTITNEAGDVLLTLDVNVDSAGVHRIDLGQASEGLAAGHYTLSVTGSAEEVTVRSLTTGVVSGVRWGVSGPLLVVDDQEVPLSHVLEITN